MAPLGRNERSTGLSAISQGIPGGRQPRRPRSARQRPICLRLDPIEAPWQVCDGIAQGGSSIGGRWCIGHPGPRQFCQRRSRSTRP